MNKKIIIKLLFILFSLLAMLVHPLLTVILLLLTGSLVLLDEARRLCVERGESYFQYSTYIHQDKRNYETLLIGSTDATFANKSRFENALDYTEIARTFDVDFSVIQNFFSVLKEYGVVVHIVSLRNVFLYKGITMVDKLAISNLLLQGKKEQSTVSKALYYLEIILSKVRVNLSGIRSVMNEKCDVDVIIKQCKEEQRFCEERNIKYKVVLLTKGNAANIRKIHHDLVKCRINTEILT